MKILISPIKHMLSLSLLLLALGSPSAWSEVAVIVHPSIAESASASDLERIFLGKAKSLPGGTKIVPINLQSGNAVRDEFNDKVLNKSDAQLKSYWSRLVFTGKAQPPQDVGSEDDMINMIKSNPNMIGYVSADKASGDVKVIASF